MVALDMLNSRMKDFFDLWAIAGAFAFEGEVLARAIQTTFERRETPLPTETPLALTAGFADAKQIQWTAFSEADRDRPRAGTPSGNPVAHRRTCDAAHDCND